MFFIVDRVEGNNVILEDENGDILSLNKNNINGQIKEGDCLRKENGKFLFDIEETKKRKIEIEKLMKGMWED